MSTVLAWPAVFAGGRAHRTAVMLMLAALLCPLPAAVPADAASAAPDPARLARAAAGIGPRDAVALAGPDGRILLAKHADDPRIPASTLKLLTALVGFDALGASYRFPTDFFLSPDGRLKIKGYGDPLLVSEVVAAAALSAAEALAGKKAADGLVLDDAYFARPLSIPGVTDSLEPYDAPNGALCVNFNTVFFRTTPAGRLVSAEPQTPLLPMAVERVRRAGLAHGRIVLAGENGDSLLYAGRLFAHFLKTAGVTVTGPVCAGRIDPLRDRLLFRYRSPFDTRDVVKRMMAHSNNFVANQMLIAAGAERFGPPGTLEKGVRAAAAFAAEVLGIEKLHLAEGSGISRQNRITARGLLSVLDHFRSHRHLMRRNGRILAKTGTLSGIQTRAGYIEADPGPYRFAVLINTPGRSADRIVQELAAALP